jgi:hypothetical protein
MMDDEYRGYDPAHYAGGAEPFDAPIPPFNPPPVNVFLSAAQLRRLFGLLNSLDIHKVKFTGNLEFDGHNFMVGYDVTNEEHFVSFN